MNPQTHQRLLQAIHHQKQGEILEAEAIYLAVLQDDPDQAEAYHLYGTLAHQQHQYQRAQDLILQAITLNPNLALYHFNLGIVFESQGLWSEAISAYQRVIELQPESAQGHERMGYVYLAQGLRNQATSAFENAIALNPDLIDGYLILGRLASDNKRMEQAELYYQKAYQLDPSRLEIILQLAMVFENQNRTEEAIQWYQKAIQMDPQCYVARWREALVLPRIYTNQEHLHFYRDRYTAGLEHLAQEVSTSPSNAPTPHLEGAQASTSFYLNYQGENDKHLQQRFSQLIHQILAHHYPHWVQSLTRPLPRASAKIKVGYISHHFRFNTVMKLFKGWIDHHDRDRFSLHCYYTDSLQDAITQALKSQVDSFVIATDFETACQSILADQLDILVLLDIPMSTLTTQLSCLRLAPIQCTTWTQPVTSGSPTVDYFISSELMEPDHGQEHYTERLVRLPGIGICYEQPSLPLLKDRTALNLPQDAVLYLSCQFFPKYLPQYDYLFPAIALNVPQAKFVFISRESNRIADIFSQRLTSAFAQVGLDYADYCLILPRLSTEDYFQVNLLCDVYLDTLSWSGGNTTLEALACGLPVVTCPGPLMRSRHSAAILQQLGLRATVATDEAHYVEIASQLGLDLEWRQDLVQKIWQNLPNIFNRQDSVVALEAFYQDVVSNHLG